MKLGVITDGISRDFEHALRVMDQTGIDYAELQFIWDKEVGDLTNSEIDKTKALLNQYNKQACCITRHVFAGLSVMETTTRDARYNQHLDGLKRCIDMGKKLGVNIVRTMSFRKEMIIFGENGAEKWNASTGSWDKLLELLRPAVDYAKATDTMLVVETGNNAMIVSCQLAVKAIQELNTNHLKILWDPANSLYCTEAPVPDALSALTAQGDATYYLGHLHIKDAVVDIANAYVRQCQVGQGAMGAYLKAIAQHLQAANYTGVIALESVYHPGNGSFEDGYHASLPLFKEIFGG